MIRTVLALMVAASLAGAVGFLLLARDIYVVQSGSMSPTLRPGDAVVVKPLDGPVHVGQVVTFEVQGKLITHRVTRVADDGIHVKGDALDEEDPWIIPADAIRGEMGFRIPYAGYLVVFIRQPAGWLSLVVVPALLVFGTEVHTMRRRGRRAPKAMSATAVSPRPRSGTGELRLVRRVALCAPLLTALAALALAAGLYGGRVLGFAKNQSHVMSAGEVRRTTRRRPQARGRATPVTSAPEPQSAAQSSALRRWATTLLITLFAALAAVTALAATFYWRPVFGLFSGTANESLIITTSAFGAAPATVEIHPETLNVRSGGRWMTAYIELPEDYDVNDIDVATVHLCLGQVAACPEDTSIPAAAYPSGVGDHDGATIADLMLKFDRQALIGLLGGQTGDIAMTVTGAVNPPGQPFAGSDTIRVIDRECGEPYDALCEGEETPQDTPTPEPSPTATVPPTAPPEPPPAAPEDAQPPPAPDIPTFEYQVQPGDTLFDIALRFGTSTQMLMQLNALTSPQMVWVGQVLQVPGVAPLPPAALPSPSPSPTPSPPSVPTVEYTVRPGERVSDVAAFFGTTVETIVALNGLADPGLVVAGQRLLVPAPPANTAPGREFMSEYVVQPGETLTDIAERFGTTVEALAAANNLANPSAIRIGDGLRVP
jgi:signal peptidase I